MTGEPAERSGLFMGLPVPLFIRRTSYGEIRDFSAPILGEQKANCQALLSKTQKPFFGRANFCSTSLRERRYKLPAMNEN
ncbi:MAG: hypothetical protein DMG46_00535 [Acidobacteria bacterium]|nr:MAG: hypothetical protein DMG46_00535 [Acidobacteriota bacterium]